MSEYRKVIPFNEKIIEDINLEENENEESESDNHLKENKSGMKATSNLQSLLQTQQSKKNGFYFQIRSYASYLTYDNMKSCMRWFLESASISFTITVNFT
mmetsp:Transcript_16775/g.22977  ORF Transcript_16775/g.22977 Transcript_16775/m.22977 type:complete len:100 (-) Transcript_16775:2812-3111(-)